MLSFCAAALAVPLNQRVASLDQAVALKQIGREVGFEDSATQPITVHGQPIFRFGKNHENATRLWLPTGVYKTLLTWEATGGKTLSLVGKTFHPRHSNSSRGVKKTDQVLICPPPASCCRPHTAPHPPHPPGFTRTRQWFDQLLITIDDVARGQGEVRVLDVSASQEDLGTMEVALDDKLMTPVPGKDTYISQEHHKVGFTVSKRSKTGADMLHVSAGGLAMSIFISKASKYTSEKDQVKFSHLNMRFDSGLPKSSTGILAELAGLHPMKPTTEKLLQRPDTSHMWVDNMA